MKMAGEEWGKERESVGRQDRRAALVRSSRRWRTHVPPSEPFAASPVTLKAILQVNQIRQKKKYWKYEHVERKMYNLCPLVVLLMPPVFFFFGHHPGLKTGVVKVCWWGNLSGFITPCSHTRPLNPLCWLWAKRSLPLSLWIGKCGRGPKYRPVPGQWWGCPSCRKNLSGRRTGFKKKKKIQFSYKRMV